MLRDPLLLSLFGLQLCHKCRFLKPSARWRRSERGPWGLRVCPERTQSMDRACRQWLTCWRQLHCRRLCPPYRARFHRARTIGPKVDRRSGQARSIGEVFGGGVTVGEGQTRMLPPKAGESGRYMKTPARCFPTPTSGHNAMARQKRHWQSRPQWLWQLPLEKHFASLLAILSIRFQESLAGKANSTLTWVQKARRQGDRFESRFRRKSSPERSPAGGPIIRAPLPTQHRIQRSIGREANRCPTITVPHQNSSGHDPRRGECL